MNKFACRKKMPIDIFLISLEKSVFKKFVEKWSKFDRKYLENYVTKVYFSLHIWKENVEIDQITNFHEKIIWQSLLYRIPLNQTWQGWSLEKISQFQNGKR
jgi:hypothetical protein